MPPDQTPTPTPTTQPSNPPGPGQQQPVNPAEPGTTPVGNPGPNPTEPSGITDAITAAPVDYTALKLPEGYQLEDAALADFRAIAAEHKLPLEAASKILEFQSTLALAARNAEEAQVAATRAAGVTELKADPDFGGIGGAKFAENLGRVKQAVTTFWGAADGEQLLKSGILDSPSFTRGLLAVAKATAEAPLVPGTGAAPRDPYRLMYPSMPDEYFSDNSKAA